MRTEKIMQTLVLAVCLLVSVSGQALNDMCPAVSTTCEDLEDETDASKTGYNMIRNEAENALNALKIAEGVSVGGDMKSVDECKIPDEARDDNNPDNSRTQREATPRRRSRKICSCGAVATVFLGKPCEPCPPRVHYLHRFYHRGCYVIFPFRQWVRYVTCPVQCKEPCWCGNTRCRPTRYIRVWFWSWCIRTNITGGFRFGLNWRWMWLPQDCECREMSLFGAIANPFNG